MDTSNGEHQPLSQPQDRAIAAARTTFDTEWSPTAWAIAPGRLELLGNHVDYNGGPVLAGAIDRSVAVAVGITDSSVSIDVVAGDVSANSWSLDPGELIDWQTAGSSAGPREYASGVIAALRDRGIGIRTGLQLSISGDVPLGFGMSSSAALCVALVLALTETRPDDRTIVLIAQDAEHRAGAPVGAMDQSASVAGGIILFDGATTSFERLHPDLGELAFAVADSGVEHSNATSSYPERVRESKEALTILQQRLDPNLASLGAISDEQWSAIQISGETWLTPVLLRRIRHIVTEVHRVRRGVAAIELGDWETFGQLMKASGRSSAEDYEISHPRVEELVAELGSMHGVLGARMMGGGEGGPALALIERRHANDIAKSLDEGYFRRYPTLAPLTERFQVCVFGPGASLVSSRPMYLPG